MGELKVILKIYISCDKVLKIKLDEITSGML